MAKRSHELKLNILLSLGLVGALFLVPGRGLGAPMIMAITWLLACLAAEALRHRARDEETILTMAPAAHLATVAVLPFGWAIPVVVLAAAGGSLLWRRGGLRRAFKYAAATGVAALGAAGVLFLLDARVPSAGGELGVVTLFRDPVAVASLVCAGLVYLVVSQGIAALGTGRSRGVSPLQVWREAYGYETELVTSLAMLTVGLLAVLCYGILGYRGILLCVMPILFVRDGSYRYIKLEIAQKKLIQNERLAAKGEMAAEIGHELNNYLAAISGRAQLLARNLDDGADEVTTTETARVRDLAVQMAGLAKGLMDFSHREVKRDASGVNELVERTVDFVRPQTRFRGIDFDFVPDPALPPVEMDPGQIQQVLLTLLGRAADCRGKPGRPDRLSIRTRTDDRGRMVAIEILPPRRAEADGAPPRGAVETELGVLHRILERHRGRFETDADVGEGELYRVVLPAA